MIIVTLFFFGLCIFIHELGHLLAALQRGLFVEKFSVGFGKKIWGTTYKGVEYVISILPFGGYVALPQLEPSDEPETSDGKKLPFAKPIDRIITAFAGPLFNILFGLLLAVFIWIAGVDKPVKQESFMVANVPHFIPDPENKNSLSSTDQIIAIDGELQKVSILKNSWRSYFTKLQSAGKHSISYLHGNKVKKIDLEFIENPEYLAGLRSGDEIIAMNGDKFEKRWMDFYQDYILYADAELGLTIKRDGKEQVITFERTANPLLDDLKTPFFNFSIPVMLTGVSKDYPAHKAGLRRGDILLEIDDIAAHYVQGIGGDSGGTILKNGQSVVSYINASKGKTLKIKIFSKKEQAEKTIDIAATKLMNSETNVANDNRYIIGVSFASEFGNAHPNPIDQFSSVVGNMVKTLKALFSPKSGIGAGHMSGPIGIISGINKTFKHGGFKSGIQFIILINFMLALFNLLPLPILDGGHITFALIEIIARRRVPSKITVTLANTFAILLISFMLFVTYKDIFRIGKGMKEDSLSKTQSKNEQCLIFDQDLFTQERKEEICSLVQWQMAELYKFAGKTNEVPKVIFDDNSKEEPKDIIKNDDVKKVESNKEEKTQE